MTIFYRLSQIALAIAITFFLVVSITSVAVISSTGALAGKPPRGSDICKQWTRGRTTHYRFCSPGSSCQPGGGCCNAGSRECGSGCCSNSEACVNGRCGNPQPAPRPVVTAPPPEPEPEPESLPVLEIAIGVAATTGVVGAGVLGFKAFSAWGADSVHQAAQYYPSPADGMGAPDIQADSFGQTGGNYGAEMIDAPDHRQMHRQPAAGPLLVPKLGGNNLRLDANRLKQNSVVVGRSSKCDVRINDQSVSRRHARLGIDDTGTIRVEDLGSTNGSWRNEQQIRKARLRDGDTVRFGDVKFMIKM